MRKLSQRYRICTYVNSIPAFQNQKKKITLKTNKAIQATLPGSSHLGKPTGIRNALLWNKEFKHESEG